MAIIPGKLYTLTGQSTLTGSFYSTLYALTNSDVYISGSTLGESSFVMPQGMRFEATLGEGSYSVQNLISKVQVNNTNGSVLVLEGQTNTL